jgi:hypothetical protein
MGEYEAARMILPENEKKGETIIGTCQTIIVQYHLVSGDKLPSYDES